MKGLIYSTRMIIR